MVMHDDIWMNLHTHIWPCKSWCLPTHSQSSTGRSPPPAGPVYRTRHSRPPAGLLDSATPGVWTSAGRTSGPPPGSWCGPGPSFPAGSAPAGTGAQNLKKVMISNYTGKSSVTITGCIDVAFEMLSSQGIMYQYKPPCSPCFHNAFSPIYW